MEAMRDALVEVTFDSRSDLLFSVNVSVQQVENHYN